MCYDKLLSCGIKQDACKQYGGLHDGKEKEVLETAEEKDVVSKNFIEQEIDKDLAEGVYDHVQTRFPGAERLSSYRTCKVHFIKLRSCPENTAASST